MVRSLASTVIFLLAAHASAQTCIAPSCFHADVVAVADGDTVTVLRQTSAGPRQVRVRLTEIDAPERGQPWGHPRPAGLGGQGVPPNRAGGRKW